MYAVYIKASGEISNVAPKDGNKFTLEELQNYVGGYMEMITTKDGKKMIMNEEGRINKLKINPQASILTNGLTVVGDVIVCDERLLQ
jgi:hypothetical protein